MKKVLILMLVFVAVSFAAQTNVEGDVMLASSYNVNQMAAITAGIEGFDVGTKGSAEIIRDLWVGSDFDQDGNKEVMLASYGSTTGRAYVYEIDGDNNATLFFDTGEMGGGYTSSTRHVAFGDLDGNGMQELLVSVNSSDASKGGIWAFEYDTAGDSMRAPVQLFGDILTATGDRWYCENFTVADVDKDGVQEILVGNNASSSTYDNFYIYSVASGTFADNNIVTKTEFTHGKTSATFPIGGSPYGGVVADLNGDGVNEVLFAPWDNGAMLIVETVQADSFVAVNYIETDLLINDDFAFWDFYPNDLNGDGRDEAYLSMYDHGQLIVVTCPVDSSLASMTTADVHTITGAGNSAGVATQMGDLDGNGRMNIYASGGGSYLSNHEFVGTDPTDSTHWVKLDNITTGSMSGVYGMRYAGDLDGDGYDEIYCANTGSSTIACAAIENVPYDAPNVIFSKYIEGSSNNKAIEIYNGTGADISLDDYRIAQTNNGSDWIYWHTFPTGTTLAAGDVWVMLNADTDSSLADFSEADEVLSYPSVVHHNGDDARAIEYTPDGGTTWYKTDQIGYPDFDPGSGWDVAGIDNATANHSLYRKRAVEEGNLNWLDAAGTTTSNSEWEVLAQNTMTNLGVHPVNDFTDAFADGNRVYRWTSANSGYTSRVWADGDTCLTLSDGGWTFDARIPVYATPGTFFEASIVVKTVGFDGDTRKYLNFGVDGLMSVDAKVSVDSTDTYTEFTVWGYAENAEGTMYLNGQSIGGAAQAYIDEITFVDDSKAGLALSSVADARMVADGDPVATKGIVTTTTEYGYSGPAYIQDGTAGIAVYGSSVSQNAALGDEILVVGTIDIYNGLVEVASPTMIILSSGNEVTPVEVTYNDIKDAESYEGQLVVMKGCDTLETGLDWAATAGSNKGFYLKDRNDSTFYCYIDKDTDIDGSPKPEQWPINITGIVGDYNGAQLLPRSLADFDPNTAPADFMILNPADSTVITSLDDPALVDMPMGVGGDSVKTLFVNWTKSYDPDANDSITYQMHFVGNGPEDEMVTADTFMYIPVDEEKPYDMNGTYTYYFTATDISGDVAMSDTNTIIFDFPAPPMIVDAQVVLIDGTPTYYAEFNLPLASAATTNFKVIDTDAGNEAVPSAVEMVGTNAVLLTVDLVEDHNTYLATSGLTAEGADVSVPDTAWGGRVLIPFSAAHPEDAALMLEGFETNTGKFQTLTYSGSTNGILSTSTFAVSDEAAYQGTKSGKMTILDDPASTGGWFVRIPYDYPSYNTEVKANSVLMFLIKGTAANVDITLTVKDTGYERAMWKNVTLSSTDWQVVAFDLANDPCEGWITGNGTVEGTTVKIADVHITCDADEDAVLYIDGFTERQMLDPVDITLNVMMHEWLRQGKFNLATDFVDVAGSFNNWDGTNTVTSDFDGDTTYSVVVPMMPYTTQYFKFRINGNWNDATAEFPYGGPARELVVPTTAAEYTYWYNDDTLVVAVDGIPTEFALHQNYPNPFNPTTTINFDLPEMSDVKLVIYDITGRKVRTLVNESGVSAGYMKINWNGRDDYGNGVSTGMYIYRLQAGDFVDVKKMTFLK